MEWILIKYILTSSHEPDKLHLKISKFILGVIRKNCNFAILSELGRFPIYISLIKSIIKYYFRIFNMAQDFLLYKALNLSKDFDRNGQNSWFSSVGHLCTILNLPADLAKLRKCKFTQLLNSSLRKPYLKLWEKNFKTVMEGKLRTYYKIKTSFGPFLIYM